MRVLVGERRAPARVIGIRDFDRQSVDVVRVESGAFPGRGEVLADVQNANMGVLWRVVQATWPRWCLGGASPPSERLELRVSGVGRDSPAASCPGRATSPCSTRGRDDRGVERRERDTARLAFTAARPEPCGRGANGRGRPRVPGHRVRLRRVHRPPLGRARATEPGKARRLTFADFNGRDHRARAALGGRARSRTRCRRCRRADGRDRDHARRSVRAPPDRARVRDDALLLGELGAACGAVLGIVLSNISTVSVRVLGRRCLVRRRAKILASESIVGLLRLMLAVLP